jgi:acetyl-CoA carboxylase biotin carboxyl carrier protein
MTPQEMKQLAELLQTVPGIKSIELEDVQGLAQLLRDTPESGSIEVKGLYGTKGVITRTGSGDPTFKTAPGIKSIELEDVQGLAQLLRDTPEIGSIEVKGLFGTKVVITRTGTGVPTFMTAPAAYHPPSAPAAAGAASVGGDGELARPVALLKDIRSPMVGTFYKSPEPGAEPYVKVGSRVTSGQTVCIIEAMKIMNEIEAEIAGVVREIMVDDAQPVEFGQVLFRVDPNG